MSNEVSWVEEGVRFGLTLLAAGAGAWLSVRFLALKAKQDEWLWQRKVEAQEFVFDTLSEISFVTHNYFKSEHTDQYSMSKNSVSDTKNAALSAVQRLHERSAGLSFLLTNEQNGYLGKFLVESQQILDEACQTYGQWYPDDYYAEMEHSNTTFAELERVSVSALENLKSTIAPVYK